MQDIKILGKDSKEYTLKVDASTLSKETTDISTTWTIKYELYSNEGIEGSGTFKIKFNLVKPNISQEEVLKELLNRGFQGLKKDIDNGQDMASRGYNFSVMSDLS